MQSGRIGQRCRREQAGGCVAVDGLGEENTNRCDSWVTVGWGTDKFNEPEKTLSLHSNWEVNAVLLSNNSPA
jgi:hypothetical protein